MKRFSVGFVVMAVLVCFGLAGCASTYDFQNKLREKIPNNEQLAKAQYYISTGVLLTRTLDQSDKEKQGIQDSGLNKGKLVIASNQLQDEKFIVRGTPCILAGQPEEKPSGPNAYEEYHYELQIGFEKDKEGNVIPLRFATHSDTLGTLERGMRFYFPEAKYYLVFDDPAKHLISYNGEMYEAYLLTDSGETQQIRTDIPYLLIKVKISDKQSKTRKKIKGLKV